MPYNSKAQQRYFHYLESKGKMPKKTVSEFDDATDFEELPERAMPKKMSMGGMVDPYDNEDSDEYDFDYMKGHESEFDSSGEPHTEDEMEDEHPMEFMNKGGKVRMYSKGGMVNSGLARALKRSR